MLVRHKYVINESIVLPPQRLVSIPDLLSAIKLLCMRFQRELVAVVDDLRLDTLLRMLKTPHFSTKMNSLKEVCFTPCCLHHVVYTMLFTPVVPKLFS